MGKGQGGSQGGALSLRQTFPARGKGEKACPRPCQDNLAPYARLWRAHSIWIFWSPSYNPCQSRVRSFSKAKTAKLYAPSKAHLRHSIAHLYNPQAMTSLPLWLPPG
jgi:hypothetical protein